MPRVCEKNLKYKTVLVLASSVLMCNVENDKIKPLNDIKWEGVSRLLTGTVYRLNIPAERQPDAQPTEPSVIHSVINITAVDWGEF